MVDRIERILREPHTWAWKVITTSLIVFSVGLSLFALLPLLPEPNPLLPIEIIIGVVGACSAIGLVLHWTVPVEPGQHGKTRVQRFFETLISYAYLGTAFAGTATLLAFNLGEDIPWQWKLVMGAFIGTGTLGALGAHLEYGGSPSIEALLDGDDS